MLISVAMLIVGRMQDLGGRYGEDDGHILHLFNSSDLPLAIPIAISIAVPAVYGVAFAPVAATSVLGYVLLSTLVPLALHWAPAFDWADSDKIYHLYRPNPSVDVYDDPAYRRWLTA